MIETDKRAASDSRMLFYDTLYEHINDFRASLNRDDLRAAQRHLGGWWSMIEHHIRSDVKIKEGVRTFEKKALKVRELFEAKSKKSREYRPAGDDSTERIRELLEQCRSLLFEFMHAKDMLLPEVDKGHKTIGDERYG